MKSSKQINITRTEALIVLALCAGKTKDEIIKEQQIVESTWFNHLKSIREKLSGGWRDDSPEVPKTPSMIANVKMEIDALVKSGRHPLIQKDVISSRALMREILISKSCYPCDVQVAQALRSWGLVSVGRMLIVGERHCLWALPGIVRNEAAGRIVSRMMGNR